MCSTPLDGTLRPHRTAAWCLALLAVLVPPLAQAALGEGAGSVDADRARLEARAAAPAGRAGYQVHELAAATTTVREFARPDGVVFAVAWSGLAMPDLEPLLGAFAADYREARPPPGPRRGLRAARVEGRQVIVETWGRPRDLHGLAWVPALVPAGVVIDALR